MSSLATLTGDVTKGTSVTLTQGVVAIPTHTGLSGLVQTRKVALLCPPGHSMNEVCRHPQRSQQLGTLAPAPKSQPSSQTCRGAVGSSQARGHESLHMSLSSSAPTRHWNSQVSETQPHIHFVWKRKQWKAQPLWHGAQRWCEGSRELLGLFILESCFSLF